MPKNERATQNEASTTSSNEESTECKFKSCFIITPIGDSNSDINREAVGIIEAAVKPTLLSQGFKKIQTAADITISGRIDVQIVQEIINSDLVLANISDNNPNVYYELAVRHAIGTPIIIINRRGSRPCFDVIQQRYIEYVNDSQGVIDLKNDLIKAINDLGNFKANNVISDALQNTKEKTVFQDKEKIPISADALGMLVNRLDKIQYELSYNAMNRGNSIDMSSVTSRDYENNNIESWKFAGSYLITLHEGVNMSSAKSTIEKVLSVSLLNFGFRPYEIEPNNNRFILKVFSAINRDMVENIVMQLIKLPTIKSIQMLC